MAVDGVMRDFSLFMGYFIIDLDWLYWWMCCNYGRGIIQIKKDMYLKKESKGKDNDAYL